MGITTSNTTNKRQIGDGNEQINVPVYCIAITQVWLHTFNLVQHFPKVRINGDSSG